MYKAKMAVAGVLLVLVLIVIGIGMWQFHWFLAAKNLNKQNQILSNSDGRQQAYVTQIDQDVRDIKAPGTPPAQVAYITGNVCDTYGKLTGTYKAQLNPSVASFVSENCK